MHQNARVSNLKCESLQNHSSAVFLQRVILLKQKPHHKTDMAPKFFALSAVSVKYAWVRDQNATFVGREEKPIFRMKECINYNPAIMILCMLAYTDHSPSSTLKYHRNTIL